MRDKTETGNEAGDSFLSLHSLLMRTFCIMQKPFKGVEAVKACDNQP